MADEIISGAVGRAYAYPAVDRAPHGVLSLWLIEAAGVHPFWSRWLVSTIHLRAVDGLPDPVVRVDGATHEIMVAGLDPAHYPTHFPVGNDSARLVMLTPMNWTWQFPASSDDSAVAVAREVVRGLVDGRLLLEPQGIMHWRQVLGVALAECFCAGDPALADTPVRFDLR
jgi:hypothetical protein